MPSSLRVAARRVLGGHDEARNLLMMAALAQDAQAVRAWTTWQELDRQNAIDPIAARWLPLVAQNLETLHASTAGSELLRRARREAWAHTQRLLTRASLVLAAFERAGIDAVLLKGGALALTVYPGAGVRPFGDVDVLVRPHDCQRAVDLLNALGWQCVRARGRLSHSGRHGMAFRSRDGAVIDLHQYFLQECTWTDVDAGVWRRIEPANRDGQRTWVAGPADQLLQICVHGLRWSPVHAGTWAADAAHLIRRSGHRVDWSVLLEEARRRDLSFQLHEALKLVASLPATTVPAHVVSDLGRSRVSFADRLERQAKMRRVSGVSIAWLFWRSWRRARRHDQTAAGFLLSMAAFVGVTSRRELLPWYARRVFHRQDAR